MNNMVTSYNLMIFYIGLFLLGLLICYLERKLNYPLGIYDGFVLFPLPPFIKRFRIFGRWFGFSKEWKFLFFKRV